jgi:hypothetical protein
MAQDPNARRDKALENIARELSQTNKLLAKIEQNTRPKSPRFANYQEPKHPLRDDDYGQGAMDDGE